jgi:20S proteasome alpha/beta subunit
MNNLARKHLQPSLFPKNKRKPVTLIIGIVCKDGIVIAGDSQTTWETGKSWSTNKITDLEHSSGHAIFAESGADITSSFILEELKILLTEKTTQKTPLPKLVRMAVRKVRDKLRFQNFECSSEELEGVINRNGLNSFLMFAHYDGENPGIYTVSLTIGIPQRSKNSFAVVGCGSDLANYLLSNLLNAKKELNSKLPPEKRQPIDECGIDTDEALYIAAYVMEIVKRHDPYCGGPTKLAILRHPKHIEKGERLTVSDLANNVIYDDGSPVFMPCQSEIDKIVKKVSEMELVTRVEFWSKILRAVTQALQTQINLFQGAAKSMKKEFGKRK